MQNHRVIKIVGFIVSLGCALPTSGNALEFYTVSMNTSPLIGHLAGPFSLDFQLIDGSGVGDSNNTAILTNFDFGGGSPSSSPSITGGASGNLSLGVSITDISFFNDLHQQFTPGSNLTFTLEMTANADTLQPDQFSFAILDKGGNEIPTLGPGDGFVIVNIDLGDLHIDSYASDTSRTPVAGGPAIDIEAAMVNSPEPSAAALVCLSLAGLLVVSRRRNRFFRQTSHT